MDTRLLHSLICSFYWSLLWSDIDLYLVSVDAFFQVIEFGYLFVYNSHMLKKNHRSSRLEVFCKKGCLRNFAKFTGKHKCQSLFFNKVAGLRPETCNFIKKIIWHRNFPENFARFLRTPFLYRTPLVAASTCAW